MSYLAEKLYLILLKIPAAIIALTVLSFGKSLCAYLLGDKSQKYSGKLTLMPNEHLDPLGFIFMLLFGIGWGKNNPVHSEKFKIKYGMALYYFSAPLANIITAVVFAFVLKFIYFNFRYLQTLSSIITVIISFNASMAVIGLIPIPPLSGYYILREFLPYNIRLKLSSYDRYFMIIFMILLITNAFSIIFRPAYAVIMTLIFKLTGLA